MCTFAMIIFKDHIRDNFPKWLMCLDLGCAADRGCPENGGKSGICLAIEFASKRSRPTETFGPHGVLSLENVWHIRCP